MKYKAGDKARVRSDLVLWKQYCGQSFNDTMSTLSGRKVTIEKSNEGIYRLVEDKNKYAWTDEMLEDVEKEFKLPEKWHIKLTSENKASIDAWRTCGKMISCAGHILSDCDGKKGFLIVDKRNMPEGYEREITFDQFKKYVLKSESTPVKKEMKFEVGKWYKYSAGHIDHRIYAKYSGNQSVSGRFYYDEIITENNGFKKGHNWSVLDCKPVLLTDLSEIQQYLPENHPDKLKKRTKKVEDLRYPDVVHCSSKEQRDKINSFAGLVTYEGDKWYLTGANGRDSEPYDELGEKGYVNYEFSDIIFPEEKAVKEWSVGSYAVLLNNYMGITQGTVSRIDCDYGHGVTISHTIDNGVPANLSKNSECKWFPTLKEAQVFSDELLGKNKVETKPKLSKEELLAEAKRRYPVGTKYKPASDDSSDIFVLSSDDWNDSPLDDVVHAELGKGCLYYKGDWAEIISKPTVEEHPKYVECIGLDEIDVMFWGNDFTVGEIYLVEEDDGTTTFKINGARCDKSQFKPSTKEAFDKQGESSAQEKEGLVQTGMSQRQACNSCKYIDNCGTKGFSCNATGGQHYPKEYIPGNRTEGYMDGIPVSERLIIHAGNMGLLRGIYNIPVETKDCFESDEIYVPIIKTEVKQIKL